MLSNAKYTINGDLCKTDALSSMQSSQMDSFGGCMNKLFIMLALLFSLTYSLTAENYYKLTDYNDLDFTILEENNILFKEQVGCLELFINESQLLDLRSMGYDPILSQKITTNDPGLYRTYSEVIQEVQALAVQYHSIVSLFSLGPSRGKILFNEGNADYTDYQHEVWCLKVSDNPDQEEEEPNAYIMGGIHSNELISVEVTMAVLRNILENYGNDQEITDIVNSQQIWFVPIINPDGYSMVVSDSSTLHRKNLRDNNDNLFPDGGNIDGVDLNRNFGYVWGDNGASNYPWSNIYHGPSEWSEIETCYIRDLIQARKFYAGITYHSYAQYILYPLGHITGARALDSLYMHQLSHDMALTIPKLNSPNNYGYYQANNFNYTCQGTMGDWSYAQERIFGYTIELGDEYMPEEVDTICTANILAPIVMMNRVNQSTIYGKITNSQGEPLVCDVYVQEVDDRQGFSDVEPVRSDSLFGRFYRILEPGFYTLRIEHPDYNPYILNNVEVYQDSITNLPIVLNGNAVCEDSNIREIYDFNIFPNPFNPRLNISFNVSRKSSEVTCTVYNLKGQKINVIADDIFLKGQHEIVWDSDASPKVVSSGVYLIKLEVDGNTTINKAVLMK